MNDNTPNPITPMLDDIIAYEQGTLSHDDTLALFSLLVSTGTVWALQGHYQRTARDLVEAGLISPPLTRAEI